VHSANESVAGTHSWWHNHTYVAAYRASARKAERVVVPSESTADDVAAGYGIPAERIVVVPQGTDEAFRRLDDPERVTATRRELLGGDHPFVLFVGKLSRRRNIPVLIEAFALAKRRAGLPHRLLLFGPNHLDIPLAQLAAEAGVAGSVVQTDGVVADHRRLVDVYNAADLFVHPSAYEGWSMTTMEALACGTAVVGAGRGGLGEVAAGHALMVQDPTAEALADAIEAVLTDGTLREELRRKAERRGSSIRWSDTTRRTLEVLREVAAQ
jgi:glycosyltransferase involved in cell wall biosynthesis